mmetsp:Transcript_20632/g.24784  ORF Transcript_20632/g.24784 Transcript_20632/m.24784 type:complete len:248 (-) Transcript_20632:561-1304(-)|eukprot:CAMPEP_0197847128 /NCGR_PEP_ID=MMETSP1438-20131217/5234_1 /TAXON_ID=1461541 /ORGANISM="Pterosperma sp., Strain CCMP1384" /LENGTH=247 /DNA_ID=CAMNT_0043458959 /DNA_START=117 /DNA_END=860 /DNA_ORIENTATION=+
MESAESIYSLIPEQQVMPPKDPMHTSKHCGQVDPKDFPMGVPKRERGTFGPPNGLSAPDSTTYLKKHAGEPLLPDPKPPTNPKAKVKAPVPAKGDKPVMGLVSAKNFVTSNAVENILAEPKRGPEAAARATSKPDYGKVPGYLKTVKKKIEHEKQVVEEFNYRLQQQAQQSMASVRKMEEGERMDLINSLKAKWQQINESYQKMTFTLDTPAKRSRKEKYEEQLVQIEKDIEMLSRRTVMIADEDYY